jgi:hypothetical protein
MNPGNFRRILFCLMACVIGLSIVLNLYFIFYKPVSTSLSVRIINRFALAGPFFTEDRIQIVPHFKIRVKDKNGWGVWRDHEKENFKDFHANPLRYDKLIESNFERSMARRLARRIKGVSVDSLRYKPELKALTTFIDCEYSRDQVDSIQVIYTYQTYLKGSYALKNDTVFGLVTKRKAP